jgi:hypothetical protein
MLWKLHYPPPRPGPGPGPINYPPALDSILAALTTHTLSYLYLDKEAAQQVRNLMERTISSTALSLSKLHAQALRSTDAAPAPGPAPTWTKDIRPLFTEVDVQHMTNQGIDLSQYDVVKSNSANILAAVSAGRMPPGNPWPPAWVQLFQNWINGGFAK